VKREPITCGFLVLYFGSFIVGFCAVAGVAIALHVEAVIPVAAIALTALVVTFGRRRLGLSRTSAVNMGEGHLREGQFSRVETRVKCPQCGEHLTVMEKLFACLVLGYRCSHCRCAIKLSHRAKFSFMLASAAYVLGTAAILWIVNVPHKWTWMMVAMAPAGVVGGLWLSFVAALETGA
jgi:hypothetical protein